MLLIHIFHEFKTKTFSAKFAFSPNNKNFARSQQKALQGCIQNSSMGVGVRVELYKNVAISSWNKNNNIHKNEVQEIRWWTNIDKYRVAANITEYHIISN